MKVERIKEEDATYNHAANHKDGQADYTLCGLDNMGDELIGTKRAEIIDGKITCPHCKEIIIYCKSIDIKDLVFFDQ